MKKKNYSYLEKAFSDLILFSFIWLFYLLQQQSQYRDNNIYVESKQ